MKVWIITEEYGTWETFKSIVAVCASEEVAQKWINDNVAQYKRDKYDYEEYEVTE